MWRLQNATNHSGGRSSTPDPAGGAYSAPPDPLAGGEGAHCPSPRILPPLSVFQASGFGPLGLASPRPNFQTPSEVKSYIRPWLCTIECRTGHRSIKHLRTYIRNILMVAYTPHASSTWLVCLMAAKGIQCVPRSLSQSTPLFHSSTAKPLPTCCASLHAQNSISLHTFM